MCTCINIYSLQYVASLIIFTLSCFVIHTYMISLTITLQEDGPDIKWEDAKRIFKNCVDKGNINYDVELVYGCPGK